MQVNFHCRINAHLYSFVPRSINMELSPRAPCEVWYSSDFQTSPW